MASQMNGYRLANGTLDEHSTEDEEEEVEDQEPGFMAEREAERVQRRERTRLYDARSSAIADRLLQGWAMLDMHCPVCMAPLLRDRLLWWFCLGATEVMAAVMTICSGHRKSQRPVWADLWAGMQRQMWCVVCDVRVVTQAEAAAQGLRESTSAPQEEPLLPTTASTATAAAVADRASPLLAGAGAGAAAGSSRLEALAPSPSPAASASPAPTSPAAVPPRPGVTLTPAPAAGPVAGPAPAAPAAPPATPAPPSLPAAPAPMAEGGLAGARSAAEAFLGASEAMRRQASPWAWEEGRAGAPADVGVPTGRGSAQQDHRSAPLAERGQLTTGQAEDLMELSWAERPAAGGPVFKLLAGTAPAVAARPPDALMQDSAVAPPPASGGFQQLLAGLPQRMDVDNSAEQARAPQAGSSGGAPAAAPPLTLPQVEGGASSGGAVISSTISTLLHKLEVCVHATIHSPHLDARGSASPACSGSRVCAGHLGRPVLAAVSCHMVVFAATSVLGMKSSDLS
eukprot:jgi/Mesen1/9560/ME000640S08904